MSHPDPLFDSDNSYEDDNMDYNYDDHNDFYGENLDYSDYNDDGDFDDFEDYYDESMDGDHDSSMNSVGWDVDEGYGYYGEDY